MFIFDELQVVGLIMFNPHLTWLKLMSTMFPPINIPDVCFLIPTCPNDTCPPCFGALRHRLEVGLHGKAAAEALQSGAERVRRELQAALVSGTLVAAAWD